MTDRTFNVLLLGDSGVGKTSFINSLSHVISKEKVHVSYEEGEMKITENCLTTDTGNKHTIVTHILAGHCFDTYCSERVCHDIDGIIIMFSSDVKESFANINLWLELARENHSYDVPIVLVQNKSDLDETNEYKAMIEIVMSLIGTNFEYISVKDRFKVNLPQLTLMRLVLKNPELKYVTPRPVVSLCRELQIHSRIKSLLEELGILTDELAKIHE